MSLDQVLADIRACRACLGQLPHTPRPVVHAFPETPAAPLPDSNQADGAVQDHHRGDEDFSAVRPYQEGDSLRRLAWKARTTPPRR